MPMPASPPQLYLPLPDHATEAVASHLDRVLARVRLPAVLVPAGWAEDAIRVVAGLAQARDCAVVLIGGDAERALDLGLDGIEVDLTGLEEDDEAAMAQAVARPRRQVGTGMILGARCGPGRHAGLIAAEKGADYVRFGPPAVDAGWLALGDTVAWWARMVETPCVAAIAEADPARIADLAAAGADFIMPPAGLWQGQDPLAALLDCLAALTPADGAAPPPPPPGNGAGPPG